MKRYEYYKNMVDVKWTKYKIVVPTEHDKEEVQKALEHCHDSKDIDTDFVTVNQLVHEYSHEDSSDKFCNVIVDKKLYDQIVKKHGHGAE